MQEKFEEISIEDKINKNIDYSVIKNARIEDKEEFDELIIQSKETIDKRDKAIKDFFGKELTNKEFAQAVSIDKHGIKAETVVSFEDNSLMAMTPDRIKIFSILYQEKDNKKEQVGCVDFSLLREDEKRILYMDYGELFDKEKGTGLDLECQLEDFCRNNQIEEIHNEAMSSVEETSGKMVGAYVWARYGYEFIDEGAKSATILKFKNYITKRKNQGENINISQTNIDDINTPRDFLRIKSFEQNIGKEFLLAKEMKFCISWYGKREVSLESDGTKYFVNYLKERNRNDLVERYYHNVKN